MGIAPAGVELRSQGGHDAGAGSKDNKPNNWLVHTETRSKSQSVALKTLIYSFFL